MVQAASESPVVLVSTSCGEVECWCEGGIHSAEGAGTAPSCYQNHVCLVPWFPRTSLELPHNTIGCLLSKGEVLDGKKLLRWLITLVIKSYLISFLHWSEEPVFSSGSL